MRGSVSFIASVRYWLYSIEDDGAAAPNIGDNINVLANHDAWYVRLYLVRILKQSRELTELVDPAILNTLAEDEDEDVRQRAQVILEALD